MATLRITIIFISILTLIMLNATCISCTNTQVPHTSVPNSENGELEVTFQHVLDSAFNANPNSKGISIHIEAPEQDISWSGSVGFADEELNRKLKPSDPALIASMTKMYMSALTLKLVEDQLLTLDQSIDGLLTEKVDSILRSDGYKLEDITIAHLLSNTSGFHDFTNTSTYLERSLNEPHYDWSRNEQITLAVTEGEPIGPAGFTFSYSDLNYSVLSEIIELKTNLPFYAAIRQLLEYHQNGLHHTWWSIFDESPKDLGPLVHQFASEYNVDSYTLHESFDIYGGGGIIATPYDAALFSQLLFNGKFYDSPETINLIYTKVPSQDSLPAKYYMGIREIELGGMIAYGHGGFWGTTVQYIPELNASISVFLMEHDEWETYIAIMHEIVSLLDQEK